MEETRTNDEYILISYVFSLWYPYPDPACNAIFHAFTGDEGDAQALSGWKQNLAYSSMHNDVTWSLKVACSAKAG